MRNVEIVKPSDFLLPSMPEELLEEDRDEAAKKAQARRVRRKVEQVGQVPSAYELAFTITINALYRGVTFLGREEVKSPFESGQQGDADAAWAMDWVVHEVTSMAGKACDASEFDIWLCRLDGVIRCAYTSLTDKSTTYARQLEWMKKAIEIFSEMVELADREGPKFLQREVAA